jgi:hypothetical protein
VQKSTAMIHKHQPLNFILGQACTSWGYVQLRSTLRVVAPFRLAPDRASHNDLEMHFTLH